VALKKISVDKYNDENFKKICEEVKIIKDLQHENVVQIYAVFVKDLEVHTVYPFFCFGSCKEAIKNFFTSGFPEIICALILKDLLLAVEYLHSRGIIHRGIRASHILLNQKRAVLSGFRDATSLIQNGERIKILHALPLHSAKSINWFAPELLEQNLYGYSEKSDVYSIGITVCELANGIAPFNDLPTTLMLTEKIRGNQPSLLDSSTFPSEEIIFQAMDSGIGIGEAWAADNTRQVYSKRLLSDPFHKFAEECMARYPESRPSVYQLLNHSFLKQCRNTNLEDQLKQLLQPVDLNKLSLENIAHKNISDSDNDLIRDIASLNIQANAEWDF
jgi:STE20-related kinase adapter protein alpha